MQQLLTPRPTARWAALAALALFACLGSHERPAGAAPRQAPDSQRPARLLGTLLQPAQVAGGQPARLLLVLNRPAPDRGVTVTLTSSDPTRVRTPKRLRIPRGVQQLGFTLATCKVDTETDVTITATDAGPARGARSIRRQAVLRLESAPSTGR